MPRLFLFCSAHHSCAVCVCSLDSGSQNICVHCTQESCHLCLRTPPKHSLSHHPALLHPHSYTLAPRLVSTAARAILYMASLRQGVPRYLVTLTFFLTLSLPFQLTQHCVLAHAQMATTLKQSAAPSSLQDARVIPDVLDSFSPDIQIRVAYNTLSVTPGATLLPVQAVHMPTVTLEGSQPGRLYTLVMSDPDAPSPEHPTHREWLHWIVTDIPGGAKDIAEGTQVAAYMPPTPPKGTHRYVFTAMEQPGGDSRAVRPPMQRGGFRTRAFVKEGGMDVVGATFFYAAHQNE